jgi:hypothetical protein
VGYAYATGITAGVSQTKFGAASPVLPKQFLTLIFNGFGYAPGVDFAYNQAWGKIWFFSLYPWNLQFAKAEFLREKAILIAYHVLLAIVKSS